MGEAGLPNASPLTNREIVLNGGLCTGLPVCRLRDPGVTAKEDRRDELNTANVIGAGAFIVPDAFSDLRDARMHLREGRATIPKGKRLPREPIGELGELSKVGETA